jgi:hypothetical protein
MILSLNSGGASGASLFRFYIAGVVVARRKTFKTEALRDALPSLDEGLAKICYY